MPNEPAESDFKHKVKAVAYPSAECGGFVWIYMGPPDKQPPLPNYHWCTQPDAERSQVRKWMQESNYSQGVEGDLDSAHVSFLHRKFGQDERPINYGAPRLTTMETDFGFAYGARRPAGRRLLLARHDVRAADVHHRFPAASTAAAGTSPCRWTTSTAGGSSSSRRRRLAASWVARSQAS